MQLVSLDGTAAHIVQFPSHDRNGRWNDTIENATWSAIVVS